MKNITNKFIVYIIPNEYFVLLTMYASNDYIYKGALYKLVCGVS